MSSPSLSIRFAFVVSLSLAASYTSSSSSSSFPPFSTFLKLNPSPPNNPSTPKATPSDLLSLLGTPSQASSIDPNLAKELRSCLKFLVPFSPIPRSRPLLRGLADSISNRKWNEENELVWWPPAPVMELARLAVDSGGDPDAIYRALDPTIIPVPDVEKSKENRCELTRTPFGRHFINEEFWKAWYLFIFPNDGEWRELAIGHGFDLKPLHQLGFHAKEYPMYDKKMFPYNMGYCQIGSNVVYDDSMNFRNILWLAPLPSDSTKAWLAPGTSPDLYQTGVIVILDANPKGIIYRDLIPEYVNYARTIYEDDLGDVVADVNYLNIGGAVLNYQLFIC
ncbi:unnamed protein product [Camellia sinensis]